MSTVATLSLEVLDRLEESRVTPQFWSLTQEIYPLLVEAMMLATLVSGLPEVLSANPIVLVQNQNLQPLPAGAMGILQVLDGNGNGIRKTFVQDLDSLRYEWENDTDVSLGNPGVVKYWFPVGLTQWGVYPKQTTAVEVTPSYIGLPVSKARPYDGTEAIPFQAEYFDAFLSYAACMARMKEGSAEFEIAAPLFQKFVATLKELTAFTSRQDVLKFSLLGRPTKITDITVR